MRQDGTKAYPFVAHTPSVLAAWAVEAKPGEWASYYTGDLANARHEKNPKAIVQGEEAWRLYQTGRFLLFQRRPHAAAPGIFDYLVACVRTAYQRRLRHGITYREGNKGRGSADAGPCAE